MICGHWEALGSESVGGREKKKNIREKSFVYYKTHNSFQRVQVDSGKLL